MTTNFRLFCNRAYLCTQSVNISTEKHLECCECVFDINEMITIQGHHINSTMRRKSFTDNRCLLKALRIHDEWNTYMETFHKNTQWTHSRKFRYEFVIFCIFRIWYKVYIQICIISYWKHFVRITYWWNPQAMTYFENSSNKMK